MKSLFAAAAAVALLGVAVSTTAAEEKQPITTPPASAAGSDKSLYQIPLQDIKGQPASLATYSNRVLLVVSDNGPDNAKALKTMVDGFNAAGIEVMVFDQLRTSPRPAPGGGGGL